ncbi:MAG TPA: family 20 glycosylhydrolase [Blastocatellia bacterium]|nr:family 20 glycosylhydrolase [Blastocatellia bacterium]
MRTGIIAFVAFALLIFTVKGSAQEERAATDTTNHYLMPVPQSVRFQPGRLIIDSSFKVAVKGHSDARLKSAIERAVRRLEGRTGLEFARGFVDDSNAATLVVQCQSAGKAIPSLDEDESYSIEVSPKQTLLNAPTVVGAIRGLETFLQLIEGDREGYFIPLASIQDRPRFRWRGLLIDACRHWEPVEVIKRNLDGMAAVKLNVLHWHLTEDQGFRVESRRFPKLHQMGSDGLYYTQDDVREVIAYARERGIRVIPEFDMPGHATSWFVGYPEIASAPGPYQIERHFGIFDPTMDPTREETYKLLDGFLGEMAQLFPDEYMHIGGDENNGKQWNQNPKIQEFMKSKGLKDNHALQAYFNQRVSAILKKHEKKMVGWDEILHPDLPNDIVIQSWRGQASLAEGAKKGYNGILSFGYYLDYIFPAAYHYAVDPIAADSNLTAQETARILGGEACMWGEYVNPETIDSRIWPRLAAIAERLWSPRSVTDADDMYRRLAIVSVRLEELGLKHESHVDRMLRRIAQTHQVAPLRMLVDIVEPVKVYNRGQAHPTTQMTPLTRLVDAARPDARAARPFSKMVDAMLSDAPRFEIHRDSLRRTLAEWRDARLALDVIIARSPILNEAAQLPKDLSDIATAGLEAISYLSSGIAPPQNWRDAKLALLDEAAKPKAEVQIVIVPALRQLIIAAAELPALKTMPPTDWAKRVRELAAPKRAEVN